MRPLCTSHARIRACLLPLCFLGQVLAYPATGAGRETDPVRAWEAGDAAATLAALTKVGEKDMGWRLLRARALGALGRLTEALGALEPLPKAHPLLTHLLAERADVKARLGLHAAAAEDLAQLMTRDVEPLAEKARIGRAWQLFLAGRFPQAAAAFRGLGARYPHYPAPSQWLSGEATSRLLSGERLAAARLLRRILVESPGAPEAPGAHETLASLRRAGIWVPPFTPEEETQRLMALAATGSLERARKELDELERRGALASRAARLIEARLFLSGYLYAEALILLEGLARGNASPERDQALALLPKARARAGTGRTAEAGAPRPAPAPRRAPRTIREARPARVRLGEHLERGEYDAAHRLLRGMDKTPTIRRAYVAFRAKALDLAARDLRQLLAQPKMARGARYWLSRVEAAQGKPTEANRILEELALEPELDWYSLLARARWASARPSSGPQPVAPHRRPPWMAGLVSLLEAQSPRHPRLGRAAALLRWGLRAEAVLELGELAREVIMSGADERRARTLRPLFPEEAWRGARHLSEPRRRPSTPGPTWRGGPELEQLLFRAFWELGEPYLASRFRSGSRGRSFSHLPTPFAGVLVPQALAHNLRPGRVWAVMAVESAYCPNVVSSAGAVGLLQIMPRTAWRIARALGERGFHLNHLFVPEVNLRFGVWYLAALLERFGGQLPLALAAYNGGPHNVARWTSSRKGPLELDSFVEEIPFAETRAYVKKVVGLTARYGVELGEPITDILWLMIDPTVSNHIDF